MLKFSIVDANQGAPKDESFINEIVSLVPRWLAWEFGQAGITLSAPAESDVLFLCHTGAVDFPEDVRRRLKYYRIEPLTARRKRAPYIITGGAIDAVPFTALEYADAVAVGEAYVFVRQLLDAAKAGATVDDLAALITAYPHAIEATQIARVDRDPARPWLLADRPDVIATPDPFVDWSMTSFIRSSPTTNHYIASKGCHLKCKFCATTYRQEYRINPNDDQLEMAMKLSQRDNKPLYLITNDAAALPYFKNTTRHSALRSQSLTVKALRDPAILEATLTNYARAGGNKTLRLGVEGVSARLRQAFGKPVSGDELESILARFWALGVSVQLFFIIGAPYETAQDWDELRTLYGQLQRHITKGMHFFKMTGFQAEPPTPLVYFLAGLDYHARYIDTHLWRHNNASNGRLRLSNTRAPERRVQALSDALSLPLETVWRMIPASGTLHLAPAIEDARRFPSEIVQWPLTPDKRWHLAESYRKIMGGQIVPAVVNPDKLNFTRPKYLGGIGALITDDKETH